ncbi:conserved hypothetical protein [Theileria equi strain WA]|uniref:G patch domain-containing protein n=1 Tax=Theileria equi strain WA TaxID=1537102 RepID=L1LCQ4_THEEQ|nr:conserved hypothetical protein [Theileria equi strain WA]EKX73121.1 conserved hypothetical protein [Theileria equi strain WA]|eukprot:XP_004832573.1 conserved hypothetical protein [Theileria equi strain WA]
MSTATFLGTPLSKYEIDDIEVGHSSEKIRNYYEAKGLQHKHTRERIRKNKLDTLYTVDTKEGWTPSSFKSSRLNRASYKFQRIESFIDEQDNEILSKRVLNSINLKDAQQELKRIIKNILNNYGYLSKVYGPQLPTNLKSNAKQFRQSGDFRGISEAQHRLREEIALINEDTEAEQPVEHTVTKLKWIKSQFVEQNVQTSTNPNEPKDEKYKWKEEMRHVYDRDIDLEDIRKYYQEYYDLIVKPIEQAQEDNAQSLLEKYTKMGEFTSQSTGMGTYGSHRVTETSRPFGRVTLPYEFNNELLTKFKIKSRDIKPEPKATEVSEIKEKTENTMSLPFQLFTKIFGDSGS